MCATYLIRPKIAKGQSPTLSQKRAHGCGNQQVLASLSHAKGEYGFDACGEVDHAIGYRG